MCNEEKTRSLRRIDGSRSANKKVLIASFYFPSIKSIATVRVGKFAEYLPEFGREPTVLTVDTAEDRPQTLAMEVD